MSNSRQSPAVASEKDEEHRSVWNAPFVIISLAYIMARGAGVVFGPAKNGIANDLGISLSELMATRTTTALVSAGVVIPAAILVSRFSPGALAWGGILLYGLGLATSGISQTLTVFYAGAILASIGSILMVPLFGQIGRDTLSIRTFVVATTIVIVFGRAAQALSLIVTGLIYESLGWRILYIIWGSAMIPAVVLAWRYIKPMKPSQDASSVRKLLSMLGWLLKRPLVWLCGISFGLTMATVGSFGFIWNINLQEALDWGPFEANLLTFMFVAGIIVGGYFVTWLSKRIGEYPSILINMSIGISVFIVCVFVTSSLREIRLAGPMLFFVGITLGTGMMIQPYVSRFFESHMSAMFFGVTTAIFLVLTALIVTLPLWTLSPEPQWSAAEVRQALVPYVAMIILGIAIFALIRWVPKPNGTGESGG
jgi:predicted MFS family arabinose efflux permease